MKTLVLVGNGAKTHSEEINAYIVENKLNVVYSMNGKGVVSDYNPLNLGMIGWRGNTNANNALNECEQLIVIGSRLDIRQIPNKSILDGKQIISVASPRVHSNRIYTTISEFLIKFNDNVFPMDVKRINSFNEVESKIYSISKKLKNVSVVTDVGENQIISCNAWYSNNKNEFITSGGLGTMGYAIPGAIGVGVDGRQVIAITGDGGFQMNTQELETIKHYEMNNIKIIVINNSKLQLVSDFETDSKIGNVSTVDEYTCPNIKRICNAYGIKHTKSINSFLKSECSIVLEITV